ncbi:diguanylate cyclase domain-containing protein [Luteitalea sp.]|jgi:diguanylate cyclase (GGDEF)-like protein|uniref:sensor domain-containing diguanylate cyclase n=1 Tax=Luteitalea sp. TaxID=2004800 RepID=UPI0037C835E1
MDASQALLVKALEALEILTIERSEAELAQAGVEIAQAVTGSRIAYLHFLNEDQETIELGVWSRDTLAFCAAVYDRHYPVTVAGIWADTFRLRQPCIHNDYASTPDKRGLPHGHATLVRHLGVPVVDEGLVRLLVGVGNKPDDYDADDVQRLELVARRVWSVMRQRRQFGRYMNRDHRFAQLQRLDGVCGLEYDRDEDRLTFDSMFGALFGAPVAPPSTLDGLLSLVAATDRAVVREAMRGLDPAKWTVRVTCVRPSGVQFPAELAMEFRAREIGRGLLGIGTLQDLSQELVVDDLRRRADTDVLTGLANRRRLEVVLREEPSRRDRDGLTAIHYIDLDGFKPVNDTLGHVAGDLVLQEVGRRLRQRAREDDEVVRLGGDEFVVVQRGVTHDGDAEVLANALVAAIATPMTILGQEVCVGASLGVAIAPRGTSLEAAMDAADRALYAAKGDGGRRWRRATGPSGSSPF